MRSLIGKALDRRKVSNDAPVPYVPRSSSTISSAFSARSAGTSQLDQLSAMDRNGTLYAILDATTTAVSATEWGLYRTTQGAEPVEDDARERVTRHAAWDLWEKPNPFFTRGLLVETVQSHLELTGLGFLLVVKAGKIPIELWFARPDRMFAVPSPDKFLAGWQYRTPDGEMVPFGTDEVIPIRKPHPLDPYAGASPVAAIGSDLDAAAYAAQYNRAFFENSAEPGGILSVEDALSDDDFELLRERWAEQHRGVARAHRVAIVEHGMTYQARQVTQRDMQFAELRTSSRDVIMEPYRVSKTTLGISDDVNLANAKAAEYQFAKNLTVPRLRRWQEALNAGLLPMFGATGKGVEFDFESPVKGDSAEENAERDSRVRSAVALLGVTQVRFDPKATLEAFGLPDIPFEDAPEPPAPVIAPPQPPGQDPDPGQDPAEQPDKPAKEDTVDGGKPEARAGQGVEVVHRCRCIDGNHTGHVTNAEDEPDLSALQQAWEKAVDRVLDQWQAVTADQRAQLRKQITEAVDDDDLARLASLTADSDDAATFLAEAMEAMARTAAKHVVDEAAAQGVTIEQATPPADDLLATATVVAALLGAALAVEAGREALRVHRPGMTGTQVATAVDVHLRGLSDRAPRDAAGGALTGAQNAGMRATYSAASADDGPVGSLYASEQLDSSTCARCREIDGRFICNTDDLAPHDRLYTALGGYVDCLGGARCRGTTVGVWRPQTTEDS